MNTQKREPNIRFNQFKELWKVVKLDSISKKVKSKNLNNTFENVLTNSAEFGIIPQRDFFDKDIANLKSLNGYYVVQPNDFVYNPRISNKAPVGPIKANFLNTTGVMSPLYYVFRTQNIDVFFLAKYFDSSYWHKFMKLNGDTGARSDRFAIKDSVFKEMPIPFPSHSEQSAIGSLFRTLDDLLASYKDNLANYQSFKATMISKMFPKAGQTVPEIRLDGFEGEWKELQLSDICQKVTEKNKDNKFNETFTNSAEFGIINQRDFFEKDISNEKSLNTYYVVRNNDFVYNPRISNYAPVGPIKRNKLGRTGVMSPLYFVFRIINSNIDLNFLETFFDTNTWHKFMKLNGDSGARSDRFAIKDSVFLTMPIAFPSLPEQQAIGVYFSNLDNLISAHKEKISQLETLKKKLLQDMFI
jgi:restriction endonuclease S subunit